MAGQVLPLKGPACRVGKGAEAAGGEGVKGCLG